MPFWRLMRVKRACFVTYKFNLFFGKHKAKFQNEAKSVVLCQIPDKYLVHTVERGRLAPVVFISAVN